jgi:hypothetical protein
VAAEPVELSYPPPLRATRGDETRLSVGLLFRVEEEGYHHRRHDSLPRIMASPSRGIPSP